MVRLECVGRRPCRVSGCLKHLSTSCNAPDSSCTATSLKNFDIKPSTLEMNSCRYAAYACSDNSHSSDVQRNFCHLEKVVMCQGSKSQVNKSFAARAQVSLRQAVRFLACNRPHQSVELYPEATGCRKVLKLDHAMKARSELSTPLLVAM